MVLISATLAEAPADSVVRHLPGWQGEYLDSIAGLLLRRSRRPCWMYPVSAHLPGAREHYSADWERPAISLATTENLQQQAAPKLRRTKSSSSIAD